MKKINVFCVLGKTGAGKTEYTDMITNDKHFMKKNNINLLVYGTTRNKRPGEIDGVDYHFFSEEEYNNIPPQDLIEFRSYYTLNDGDIHYFTTRDFLNTDSNIICSVSPYQYDYYRNWIIKENIKNKENNIQYDIHAIIVETDIKTRIRRLLNRSSRDDDIYEMCRRVIQERIEFDDVMKKVPELADPLQYDNSCLIINDSDKKSDIKNNLDNIKNFILKHLD